MNIEQLLKIIPRNIKINIPKNKEAWEKLEKATLEVLYKIKEERKRERAKKVIESKLHLVKSSDDSENINSKNNQNYSDDDNTKFKKKMNKKINFKEIALFK